MATTRKKYKMKRLLSGPVPRAKGSGAEASLRKHERAVKQGVKRNYKKKKVG